MDSYQISYVNCGRDVLRFGAASSGTPAAALVVTDPDFDLTDAAGPGRTAPSRAGRHSRDLDRRSWAFGRLPGTPTEGAALARLLGVAAWQGRRALERRGRLRPGPARH